MAMLSCTGLVSAQECNPFGAYTNRDGEPDTLTSSLGFSGSAPLTVRFEANPDGNVEPGTNFEWHFTDQRSPRTPFLIRYEQDTEYTFTSAGSFSVRLYQIVDGDTISIYDPITVSISESELLMPNAFSPNGDGINDIYKAKSGYKSIVEFKAVVFNRWGQKLYEWTDPEDGWDGTFHGKNVAEGVYFVNVKAKGADGREFHIRRDVNLLRGYNETTTTQP